MASASRKVIRKRRSWIEQFRWIANTTGEPCTASDARYFVLTGSAALERILEDAIRYQFGKLSRKQVEELFAENAPLGTFSAKIRLGSAMRLYGPHTKADLNHLREIRNIFAHAERPITFATQRVRELCAALQVPRRFPPDDPSYKRAPYQLWRLTVDMLTIEVGNLSAPRGTKRPRLSRPKLP